LLRQECNLLKFAGEHGIPVPEVIAYFAPPDGPEVLVLEQINVDGTSPSDAEIGETVRRLHPETFNFLGFTHYCSKTRNGKFVVKRKTQAKRLVRKLKAIREDMLDRMHTPVREQHRWLRQVLRGHYQYYGVIFNYRALRMFKDCVVRLWRKTLGKRSQKGRVTWASYNRLLTTFPLPEPVIHQAWHR
jgi:hypothetical protein